MGENKIKILVLGQTPPPFLGQAMMIDRLVKGRYDRVEIIHVRMAFSDNLKMIGKFGFKKLLHLFYLIWRTIYIRFRHKASILYYPPSGPHRNPLFRDIIILLCIRPFFRKIIFHFRAAGVSQLLERSSPLIRFLGRTVYDRPDGVIQQSILNPADGKYFKAKQIFIIKNGLEDAAKDYLPIQRTDDRILKILFVGAMYEERGILIIVEALNILRQAGINFRFTGVGDFVSREFENQVLEKCRAYGIENNVTFPGTKIGQDKWKFFLDADVFCFPSFVESESFGNVVAEAMMFQLPVIASRWNALPDLVKDSETGFLVPIQDSKALADKILILAADAALRKKMGIAGRERFLSEYQLSTHLENMEKMFLAVAHAKD
jgi:glycosyltransferase involved in cell wall biosynthesis